MLLFAWIWDPKNHPKTSWKPCPGDPKIYLENMLFFNIDFFAFWPRFWSLLGLQDGAKSAALLAAPGVSNPTAFYACINILLYIIPCASHVPPRCRWRRKAEGECQQGFLQKLQHNVQKCFQKSFQERSKSRKKRPRCTKSGQKIHKSVQERNQSEKRANIMPTWPQLEKFWPRFWWVLGPPGLP